MLCKPFASTLPFTDRPAPRFGSGMHSDSNAMHCSRNGLATAWCSMEHHAHLHARQQALKKRRRMEQPTCLRVAGLHEHQGQNAWQRMMPAAPMVARADGWSATASPTVATSQDFNVASVIADEGTPNPIAGMCRASAPLVCSCHTLGPAQARDDLCLRKSALPRLNLLDNIIEIVSLPNPGK
jgi:hypothetical protein